MGDICPVFPVMGPSEGITFVKSTGRWCADCHPPGELAGDWHRVFPVSLAAAAARKIPVYTVSVGDPQQEQTIPHQGEALRHQGQVVKTTVQEAPLEEIASASGGVFIPARTNRLALGKVYRDLIEPRGQKRENALAESNENLQPRYVWFLAPAFLFFVAGMLVAERRWDMRLENGITIRLPERGADAALAELLRLDREHGLLSRDIAAVDLRIDDRLVVKLTPAAALEREAALAALKKAAGRKPGKRI